MSEQDPKRLLEGGASPGELRSLLEAGRSEMPSSAQMIELAAKMGILGGLGGAGAAGAGGGAAAGAGAGAGAAKATGVASAIKAGLAMKVIGAVAIAGAAGAGAVVVANRTAEPVVPVGLVATASASANANANANADADAGEMAVASASAPRPARSVSANVASAEVKDEGPQAEVKLLERAQDALRSRPAEALALCTDHVKRFPSGMLVQEREVIAIEALVKTGRKDEARARADRFKARFPGSSHTRRLETLLGN